VAALAVVVLLSACSLTHAAPGVAGAQGTVAVPTRDTAQAEASSPRPGEVRTLRSVDILGATLSNTAEGVRVTAVEPGSRADEIGMRVGNIINGVKVGDEERTVRTVDNLIRAGEDAKARHAKATIHWHHPQATTGPRVIGTVGAPRAVTRTVMRRR